MKTKYKIIKLLKFENKIVFDYKNHKYSQNRANNKQLIENLRYFNLCQN